MAGCRHARTEVVSMGGGGANLRGMGPWGRRTARLSRRPPTARAKLLEEEEEEEEAQCCLRKKRSFLI
ncbi:hypothetical protein BRADI_3g52693v3 [Brachypodium distachyon]|uniref:Uncharacterized protein n=1 Tax=Brachypodium distachyon TaxID=15368 RepID=A0A0Q3FP22_BRADI|nr:hypothetical protein BRADI_3g52693v3 [Brachypodium distachyon]